MALKEINEYLKNNYSNLGKIKGIKLLDHNNINSTNYLIYSNNSQFVLRNFTDRSHPEKVERMCRILQFCIKKKNKVLEPIKNDNTEYVDKKNKIYLTKYYEGEPYKATSIEIKEISKNLAMLHKTLVSNPIEYSYRKRYHDYRILTRNELQKIKKIIKYKKIKDLFDKRLAKNTDYLLKCSLDDEKTSKIINTIHSRKQLIHADFYPDNIILKGNRVAAIIDFNSMRIGRKIEDVAFASFRFSLYQTSDIKEIVKRIKLFVNTYLRYNEIPEAELACLGYFFTHEILCRLSYICRMRYFINSNLWDADFTKQLKLLKLANKVNISLKTVYEY